MKGSTRFPAKRSGDFPLHLLAKRDQAVRPVRHGALLDLVENNEGVFRVDLLRARHRQVLKDAPNILGGLEKLPGLSLI